MANCIQQCAVRQTNTVETAHLLGLVAGAADAEEIEFLNSGRVLPDNLPFSEAVRVGDTVYLSGQIGSGPGTLELVPGGVEAEARQVMQNIKTTLEAHELTLDDVAKCTVMLADMADWPAFNKVYAGVFQPGRYPARSAFGSSGLALGAKVEVECIAVDRAPPAGAPPAP